MIVDVKGNALNPLDAAMQRAERLLSESLFGMSADVRVHEVRRSVLGDEAGAGPSALGGLAAWLPEAPPAGVIDLPFFGLERNPPLVVEG